MTVWSLIWLFLYDPSYGAFAAFLRFLGLGDVRMLDDPGLAMPAISILSVWKGMPVYMLIFLAGLRAIPADYYEAAKVDGASAWQRFIYITLPQLRPVMLYVVVISVIEAFKVFTPMYLMTHGGPGSARGCCPCLSSRTASSFSRWATPAPLLCCSYLSCSH